MAQGRDESSSIEFDLLLSCTRVSECEEPRGGIRALLGSDIDWPRFVRMLVHHDLAEVAARRLLDSAPDLVPEDILDAFQAIIERSRVRDEALLAELARIAHALVGAGVQAIAFRGAHAGEAIELLVQDRSRSPALSALSALGYARKSGVTAAQLDRIHTLQGRERLVNETLKTDVEMYTRLVPHIIAADIDYAALWRRAQPEPVNGRSVMTLSTEDALLTLAVLGGAKMWRRMGLAHDFAALAAANSSLDWIQLLERARAQGCLRMLLVAVSIAQAACAYAAPDAVMAAAHATGDIERTARQRLADWRSERRLEDPEQLSMARLRLHDGLYRQVRHATRALLSPEPRHVESVALPARLQFAYAAVKAADRVAALPAWRASRQALERFGLSLRATPRQRAARKDAERALARNARNPRAWRNLGNVMFELKRFRQAIDCYDRSIALAPDSRQAWGMRSAAIRELGSRKVVPDPPAADSEDPGAWLLRAGGLWYSKRLSEAAAAAQRALALDPENERAARLAIHCRLHACDWSKREEDKRRIRAALAAGRCLVVAGDHMSLSEDEQENYLTAQLLARQMPAANERLWKGERFQHSRIRLAYLSSDFRQHPVSTLFAGCLEAHDRSRFELTAVSLAPDDGSEQRRRIAAAVDHFIDAHAMEDGDVARLIREREIDVVVDLNGYTDGYRPAILARRPAPVQANYLGYAGTTCLPFRDYIIADRIVIPEEKRACFSENVVYLPHCYLPNDRTREIAEPTPSRPEAQLPPTGFVFACFNESYKISPEIFGVWMSLLRSIEHSVLWLRTASGDAMGNLRREARLRGVAPERLIFAPRLARAKDHLARHRLADLCLDTLPRNLHSTACDALWAGLPLVTCLGNTFTGRVAGSALHAVGLPELVTCSLSEYEDLARSLAANPARLESIKAKLARTRDAAPLFDTDGHTRHLEAAYVTMWERQQKDMPPESFAVPA